MKIINKVDDYYKNHEFMAIPICGFNSRIDGKYLYDLDAMQDEVDNAFKSIGLNVLCTISEIEEDK